MQFSLSSKTIALPFVEYSNRLCGVIAELGKIVRNCGGPASSLGEQGEGNCAHCPLKPQCICAGNCGFYPCLGAVCRAADLLRLGVDFFDRVEHRLWVGRLSHGLCYLIDPVANKRIIPTKLA